MAQKRANTLFNMASSLFIVTSIAAIAMAGAYNLTKGPIEEVKKKKVEEIGRASCRERV